MRSFIIAITLVLASLTQVHAQTVQSEVRDSIRGAYGLDVTASQAFTRAMLDWQGKVLNGQPVNQDAEIKFYVTQLRLSGIDLCQIATPKLAKAIRLCGL